MRKWWLCTENAEEDATKDTKTIVKEANQVAKKHEESGWWEEPGFLELWLPGIIRRVRQKRQTASKASWSLQMLFF